MLKQAKFNSFITAKIFVVKLLFQLFQKSAFCLLLLMCFIPGLSPAQQFHDFGFEHISSVKVFGAENVLFDLAWTGGLNACQVHKFDLNFNGTEDLIIFDRHGHRLLTFLNDGTSGEYAYSFAPEFIEHFPEIRHWVQLIDYDGDGKKDIFTYTTGGIKVYRNISDTEIRFEQVTFPFIRSLYGNIQTNLLVTSVDYPAIVDMDGDGDLDILTFWGLGTFLELHTNNSIEYYGHRDSMAFVKTGYCWGRFAESDESNLITLDTCLNLKSVNFLKNGHDEPLRHTGSTLLMLDMTGNGLKDLILGDVDYPGLYLLINEGSQEEALITIVETNFPAVAQPVFLHSFPVASYTDISNNGVNDLVVSPFDPSLQRSTHHKSVWLYRNIGTNELPVFEYLRNDLFQHRMIDVGAAAMPVLYDLDGDGLKDLIVGNFGYNDTCYHDAFFNLKCYYTSRLALYKNTGSATEPEFTLITDDFASLSALGLRSIYPTFADLDGDGSPEMLIGNEAGNLILFKAPALEGGFPDYVLADNNYHQIHAGAFSTPQLFDLNSNGLSDLIIGQQNGKLSWYQNQGNATQAVFVKITDELGGVNVTDPMLSYTGHSIPHFFRDSQNRLCLFVGSESGKIFYYNEIENNLNGTFHLAEERLLLINEGIRTAAATAFLTGTDYPDMIVGNYGGGLSFYKGSVPKPIGIPITEPAAINKLMVYPNPASDFVTVDFRSPGKIKYGLTVYDFTGRMVHKGNDLSQALSIIPVKEWHPGIYLFVMQFEADDGSTGYAAQKVLISK